MEIIGQMVKVITGGSKVKFVKNAPIKLKFTWNDICDFLNILKTKWRS